MYTLAVSITETANYKAEVINPTLKVKAATVGSVNYTVEDAVTKGGTVTLAGNAFIASNLTIPSGVTLILPSGESNGDKYTTIGKLDDKAYNNAGERYYVDMDENMVNFKLTILSNTHITVNGNILIQGLMGSTTSSGQPYGGHTAGKHSQIINNGV